MPAITPIKAAFTMAICVSSTTILAEETSTGRWITGDLHVHTALSADARTHLDDAVHKAFDDFHLDYMAISNHLRNNSGNNVDDKTIQQLFSKSLREYEWPKLQELRKAYPNKLLISSFEWDMPTHDHINIGILTDNNTEQKLAATEYFEYRFGAKNTDADFSSEQLARFKALKVPRQNRTHDDGVAALKWLQNNYPDTSYVMLNHPTRHASSYHIEDIRQFNDIAPDIFFLLEGMVGNQFNGYRGDYDDKSRAGLWGGSDPFTAEVGGNWDALLAEGRHIWLVANSDHHFKAIKPYSSGYFPGEYAKTYVHLNNEPLNQRNWLEAMRSGNSFSVFGDIINGMGFTLTDGTHHATMGETLNVKAGEKVTVSIRLTQAVHSNREKTVGNEIYAGKVPPLHHVDLIAGDMIVRAKMGSQGYKTSRNSKTRIIKTFTAHDWTVNHDGSYTMKFTFTAQKDTYYRLRGTSLGVNQTDFTKAGEPVRSKHIAQPEKFTPAYYEAINQRNYTDTWFYSNPVFVNIN